MAQSASKTMPLMSLRPYESEMISSPVRMSWKQGGARVSGGCYYGGYQPDAGG